MNSAQESRPEQMILGGHRANSPSLIDTAASATASVKTRRLLVLLATGLGVIPWIAYASLYADAIDARAYFYAESGSLYGLPWGEVGAFVYTPAFSQAIEPLRWLGFEGFLTAWRLLETAGLAVIAGPLTGPLLFAYPVPLEIGTGNVQLILAAAIVAGFRWPAAWSVVLLTKVTPGIGLLWFAVRGEWRNLGIALGATAAIVAVSFALSPQDWLDWLAFMAQPHTLGAGAFQVVTAPLWLRLGAGAVLVTWGARTDRRWTVLVAAFLALPSVWLTSMAMLAGLWALRKGAARTQDRTALEEERTRRWAPEIRLPRVSRRDVTGGYVETVR